MTKDEWADVGRRVGHTFWQAGVASLPATVPLTRDALESVALSFAVAGGAAVLALVKGMVKARRQPRR